MRTASLSPNPANWRNPSLSLPAKRGLRQFSGVGCRRGASPPSPTNEPLRGGPVLRWGVLAPGGIARDWVTSVHTHTDQRAVAVGSRSAERAEAFARAHGIRDGTRATRPSSPIEVDAVYIAAPHTEHLALALLAIAAGKRPRREAPRRLGQARPRVARAAADAGVFAMDHVSRASCRRPRSSAACSTTGRSARCPTPPRCSPGSSPTIRPPRLRSAARQGRAARHRRVRAVVGALLPGGPDSVTAGRRARADRRRPDRDSRPRLGSRRVGAGVLGMAQELPIAADVAGAAGRVESSPSHQPQRVPGRAGQRPLRPAGRTRPGCGGATASAIRRPPRPAHRRGRLEARSTRWRRASSAGGHRRARGQLGAV